MHRFFVESVGEGMALLSDDETRHIINVLRLNPGDVIEILDGNGNRFSAVMPENLTKHGGGLKVLVTGTLPNNEPKTHVTLYQGIPKQDKLDSIVQKCVEIGVREVVPVLFDRCVAKPGATSQNKTRRYNRIAREAAKQCARGYVPIITDPMKWNEAISHMRTMQTLIFPWEEAVSGDIRHVIKTAGEKIGIIIGPEGGVTQREAREIAELNSHQITLGPRILRTETAGPVVLAMVLTLLGDMGGDGLRE